MFFKFGKYEIILSDNQIEKLGKSRKAEIDVTEDIMIKNFYELGVPEDKSN